MIHDKIKEANAIVRAASAAGIFLTELRDRQLAAQVRKMAKQWVNDIERQLSAMAPADALTAIATFDIIHRIAHGVPANPQLINKYTLKAFDAYISGDKTVDEYTLFRQIATGLRRKDPAYADRPLRWHSLSLARWHKQFASGDAADTLSDYDTAQRVTILLQSDLWALETRNEAAYKHRLHTRYSHLLPA
ncbi:MAG: hypothetical protein K2G09_00035 [Paramuribaculum sp.]|nr:hypothetical protein [Paramuribaculum sp.]